MRCALFVRKEKTRRLPHQTSQFQSVANISSNPSYYNVSQFQTLPSVDQIMGRQTRNSHTPKTEQPSSTASSSSVRQTRSSNQSSNKGASKSTKSEVASHRPTGGRHLQPPTGNDAKLKHKCPFEGCPWRFATPYKLRRHIKSHTKETPYQCKECGRGFSVRYNLLMHIQTIHSTPQKYSCPVKGCKEAFHTQPRLNGHLRKVHKTDMKQIQAEKKEESVTPTNSEETLVSPSSSSSSSSLEKTFPCNDCDKTFSSQAKLSTHSRTHSSGRPHKCTVEGCLKSFQTTDKLEKHMQTHSSVKSWICPYKDCKRVFLRQSYLKNHLKVHTKEQYLCPVPGCGHRLSTELDYNDHVNLHMGYSLPCPQCSLVFPTPKRLELHCRVAHATTNDSRPSGFHIPLPTPPSPPTSSFSKEAPPPLYPTHSVLSGRRDTTLVGSLETGRPRNTPILPDLRVEEVEAVISRQTDNLLIPPALNSLSDMGTGLGAGYESDSGYSTFDVSPHGSHASSGLFNNLLSPAITPVTPTSVLNNSPIPFTFSDDGLTNGGGPMAFFPPPLSAGSSCDNNYFFSHAPIGDSSALPRTPTDALSDHSPFPHTPTTCPPTLIKVGGDMMDLGEFPNGLQTAQHATRNFSNIEESKQTVLLVPNDYSTAPLNGASPLMSRPQQLSSAVSNFPRGTAPELMHKGSVAVLTTPPPVRVDESVVIKIKPLLYDASPAPTSSSCHAFYTDASGSTNLAEGDYGSMDVKPVMVTSDSGRMVYAQIVSSQSGLSPPLVTPTNGGRSLSFKGVGKSPNGAGKSRHRSNSAPTKQRKGIAAGKSQWPKSMNPGNLVAFRNFILKKLNKDQQQEVTSARLEELTAKNFSENILSPIFGCDGDETMLSGDSKNLEDIFKDIDFNPDSLLSTSESPRESGSLSPTSSSQSVNDVSDPFSPSGGGVGGGSTSSTEEHNGMDFEGFFHLFDTDPLSAGGGCSSMSEPDLLSLSQDLDLIFKTDADPLLGGIS